MDFSSKKVMFMDFHGKKCGFSLILMGKCRSWEKMWMFMDFHWKYVDFHVF